jgi:endonuclease III
MKEWLNHVIYKGKTMRNNPKNHRKILQILKKVYPDAECALVHESPLQLLLATILSAQCTDQRVNEVTKTLFKKYRTAKEFARAGQIEVEKIIHSTGFFRQKAYSIRETCRILEEKFGGEVPKSMEELTALPGVGRKTANVVMGNAFGIASGVVVDTHVRRLSNRLGLTRQDDPVKIEQDLIQVVPKEDWIWISHALISHGRAICKAVTPLCAKCPLNDVCPASRV